MTTRDAIYDHDKGPEGEPLLSNNQRPNMAMASYTKYYQVDDIDEEQCSLSSSSRNDETGEQSLPPPPPPGHLPPLPTGAKATKNFTRSKISSLDFESVINTYSIQATRDRYFMEEEEDENYDAAHVPHDRMAQSTRQRKHLRKAKVSTGRTATRWALSAIVGLFTGITTIFIVSCTGNIVRWRTRTLDAMAQSKEFSNVIVFVGYATVNVILAVCSCLLCVYVAPEGAGSGIPEVKAYLNGVRVKKFSSWNLFAVKIVGTILSVSSSLAVGMEGPLIHIGAIVGASFSKLSTILSRLITTNPNPNHKILVTIKQWLLPRPLRQFLWNFATTNLSYFSIDSERRDFVSIGASVGFAASFGAPIGGLLFILDDISSYFSKNMFLRTLVANAIGTFCLAVQSGDLSNYSVINLGTYHGASATDIFLSRFELLPLYLLMGVAGGALGGIFCVAYQAQNKLVSNRLKTNGAKLVHVAALSLFTSALMFWLPITSWACRRMDDGTVELDNALLLKTSHPDHGRQFFCAPGHVNEMATIMFGSRDEAIKRILADPGEFEPRTLLAVGALFYGLMTLTIGSVIPCGIFTPTVLVGASLGGAAGLAFQEWFEPALTPSTFALLGVAAMLAGIQRSTVSISVILVEGTGQIKVLLPVIMVVLIARYVAEWFDEKGFYETTMRLKNYPYLAHVEKRRYDIFEVREIMSGPAEVIGPLEKASHLVQMLAKSSHNGFPVVDPHTKKFLGLVRRDQIVALLECGVFEEGNDTTTTRSGSSQLSILSTPRPGFAKSPLMHWAYHINDDRFDHVDSDPASSVNAKDDEFDRHQWLRNIHDTLRNIPEDVAMALDEYLVPTAGDDSLPPLRRVMSVANQHRDGTHHNQTPFHVFPPPGDSKKAHPHHRLGSRPTSTSANATPKGFAEVGVNLTDNLVVTWLNPEYRNKFVNVAAVMNRGTYCVPEFLPVSKARLLFTQLGLRHVVVLGGKAGNEVVGVFTRANLMPSYIEEKTGVTF